MIITPLLETMRGLVQMEGGKGTWVEVAQRCGLNTVQELHNWRRGRVPTVDTVQSLLRAFNVGATHLRVILLMDGDEVLIRLAPLDSTISWPEPPLETDGEPIYFGAGEE